MTGDARVRDCQRAFSTNPSPGSAREAWRQSPPLVEGRAGGRKARSRLLIGGPGPARARRYFGPSPLRLSHNRASGTSCRMNGGPWIFQSRRGGCRTPESRCVTPTVRQGSVPPFRGTSILCHTLTGFSGAASFPRREAVSRNRVPLGKERSEYGAGRQAGDKCARASSTLGQ
jgi:hypothetical protein